MTIEHVPLSRLRIAPENVRRTDPGANLEPLVASIRDQGLLQNLVGYKDDSDGTVAIVAGGRRLRALTALAEDKSAKRFRSGMQIPVQIRDRADFPTQTSLAENVQRAATHPMDECEAFASLIDQGRSAVDIAKHFGTTLRHVEGRLRLGRLHQDCRDAYRAGEITLDQAAILTIADSHPSQVAALSAFRNLSSYNRSDYYLRQLVTSGLVDPRDRLVRYVGLDSYLAAGGGVSRDLFTAGPDDVVALTDSGLLSRLAGEKLAADATAYATQGWKWVETSLDQPDHNLRAAFTFIPPVPHPLSEDDRRALDALQARLDQLQATEPDDIAATDNPAADAYEEEDGILNAIAAIEDRQLGWTPPLRAAAGVILAVGRDGQLSALPGAVRTEDRSAADEALRAALEPPAGDPSADQSSGATPGPVTVAANTPITTDPRHDPERTAERDAGYSAALDQDLGAYRQQIVKAVLATRHDVAYDLVLFTMLAQSQRAYYTHASPLDARFAESVETSTLEDVRDTRADAELQACRDVIPILGTMPTDHVELYDAVVCLPQDQKAALFAWCVARCVTLGLSTRAGAAQRVAERLGQHLAIDVAAYWRPTPERYFSRVRKAHLLSILDTVGLAKLARAASGQKKPELVAGVAGVFDPATRPSSVTPEQAAALDGWLPPSMAFAPAPEASSVELPAVAAE